MDGLQEIFPILRVSTNLNAYIITEILEVDVYPNSTTILLDKLKLKIDLNSNNYSSIL